MAIKIQGSTIIDDSRNIVSAGIATINTKIDVGAGGTIFSADANVSNDNILSVKNVSLNPALDITGIGSVGIGITNPLKSLHVDGTGLLVASGSTTLFSVESFTPNSNVFEVYDRENSIILGVSTSSVGIGSTNIFTITPQVTQTAIGIGTDELITLAPNSGSDNIFQVTNASGSIKHFVVANNGNIGVGTTNPSQKLHIDGNFLVSDGSTEVLEVNGSSGNPLSIQSNSLSPAFDVTGIGSVGIGTTQPSAIFEVVSGGAEIFRISDTLSDNYLEIDTDKFVINSSGNAGIGTTNPTQKLDVNGNVAIGGSVYDNNNQPGTNGQVLSNVIGFGVSWTDAPTGEVNVNEISSGSYYIGAFETTGTTAQAYIETTNPVVLTSAGNIGIGSTQPTQKLDVIGNTKLAGQIRDVNNSAGTSNYVLASGGPGGNWSWQPVTDVGAGILDAVNIKQNGSNVGTGTATEFDFYENFSITQPSAGIASVRLSENINITGINTSTGNLGIGTTNPQAKLDVNGNVAIGGSIYDANGSPGNNGQILSNVTGIGLSWANTATPAAVGSDGQVQYNNSGSFGGASALYYDDVNNRVGVGTTNPQTTLHVVDEFLVSTAGAASTQRITERAYTTDNGTLSWEGSAGQLFSITNNLTSGSIFSVNDVSGIPSIDVDADGTIQLAPFGATEFVGVGTTNPTAKLDVNGNLNVSGVSTLGTVQISSGIVTATSGIVTYYGDGSGLTNLPAPDVAPSDGQDFNTGITTTKYASASNDIDGFTAIAVTFPSTAGRTYLVESIHVTNVSAGDLYITSRIDYDGGEDVPFTNKVLIPEQGAIDIVDESIICNPSDNIRLAAYNGIGATAAGVLNVLDCFVTYTEKTDTNYIGIGSTTKSTFTDETVFTSNTNPSIINTIVLTNNSDVADIDASVSMFRGGTIRQGYFVYNLTIPQNSSVQILPKAKRLNATDTIVVNSSSTSLGINVAGKYIT